jgi:hypothetical protein
MSALSACDVYDPDKNDSEPVRQTLELAASQEAISLNTETPLDELEMTFEWTPARQLSDDYIVSYVTELDVLGNNFGSTTVVDNVEDDGTYSRTFTYEQINNLANDRWKIPINTPFQLEFRITATWDGPGFQAPEVGYVSVAVTPVEIIVFEADNMFIGGDAIAEETEIHPTLENGQIFAWVGDLTAGGLSIPVVLDGKTQYIVPADKEGTLQDGTPEAVTMSLTEAFWNITTPGKYRVVVDMDLSRITIYSPSEDLQPRSIDWALTGETPPTIVNEMWNYGESGWAWKNQGWSQSLADPQVFVYSGTAFGGRVKFGVTNSNSSYVFTCGTGGAADNVTVTHGTVYTMVEGYGGGTPTNERNTYFVLPGGTNFIIVDLRRMTMVAEAR